VGSITHCAGYAAAGVAEQSLLRGLGIDAEPHQPLRPGVMGKIAAEIEIERTRQLADIEPLLHWDRLLFSAKEAVFKALFPLTSEMMRFSDLLLAFEFDGTFAAWLSRSGPSSGALREVSGRWAVRDVIVTSASIPSTPG
jgi:4'-phosphopantetheinyl transferase EntD